MSLPRISFTNIDVLPQNKKLEKDADGYYKMDVGAFNCFNSAGEFYLKDNIEETIKGSSSAFMRRITSGYLKGEAGHPAFVPGMSAAQYYARNMRIELTNVSHHIKAVDLVPTATDSGLAGKGNIIKVVAWLRPTGAMGDGLAKDLEDPNCNVAFSIRCITNNQIIGGVNHKALDTIITWDWVLEPGIKYANKADTLKNSLGLTIESLDTQTLDIKALLSGVSLQQILGGGNFSIEDSAYLNEITMELRAKYSVDPAFKHLRKW